ncbi:hypothetical protein Xmau_04093 [Xenorhabdus mauleonii]|uniref:Pyosin/cloacin translocation domain-containing protein n=1 Tax=Xenorhabdus mauleonii TaxID=351675 RepID=A0A2G0NQC2_9GAMM|nr:hypothetical protein Xmau_04093 [Xenorhabdus mauleonii]
MFPRAEANPLVGVATVAGQQTNAVIVGSAAAKAANQGNDEQNKGSQPLLSKNERQTLEGIQSSLTRDYQLASASVNVLGMMLRSWWNGGDDDLFSHEHLKKIADNKGTAETRVRYRFAENAETGQLTAVGYHTSKENMLEPVKVRHVQYNKSLNRYEFWEDGASSPTLVWYQNAASGGLSQQDIDKSVSQDATVNVKVAVLDPQATGQTPGLPIPEEKDWRDGAYINPQQDPSEIGGNSTSTPIPDARDNGPTKLTTPAPEEKDFRDYILIFPVSNIPAIYVYLSLKSDNSRKDEEYYKRKIQEFESTLATEDVHGLRRHGPGTTLEQQNYRAKTGYTPDGRNGIPTDSTRFLSYKDQYEAIQKALPLYNPEIHKTGRVDFDMGKTVSEGYKKGGKEYFETSVIRAGFDKKTGKIYSIFGVE